MKNFEIIMPNGDVRSVQGTYIDTTAGRTSRIYLSTDGVDRLKAVIPIEALVILND